MNNALHVFGILLRFGFLNDIFCSRESVSGFVIGRSFTSELVGFCLLFGTRELFLGFVG